MDKVLKNIAGHSLVICTNSGSTHQLAPREEVTLCEEEISGNSLIENLLKNNYLYKVSQKVVKSTAKHTKKKERKGTKS